MRTGKKDFSVSFTCGIPTTAGASLSLIDSVWDNDLALLEFDLMPGTAGGDFDFTAIRETCGINAGEPPKFSATFKPYGTVPTFTNTA